MSHEAGGGGLRQVNSTQAVSSTVLKIQHGVGVRHPEVRAPDRGHLNAEERLWPPPGGPGPLGGSGASVQHERKELTADDTASTASRHNEGNKGPQRAPKGQPAPTPSWPGAALPREASSVPRSSREPHQCRSVLWPSGAQRQDVVEEESKKTPSPGRRLHMETRAVRPVTSVRCWSGATP